MVAEQFSSFKGSGQFRQRDETACFGESVNYGKYGGIALRIGKIVDKSQLLYGTKVGVVWEVGLADRLGACMLHAVQFCTNLVVSVSSEGLQKRFLSRFAVALIPG